MTPSQNDQPSNRPDHPTEPDSPEKPNHHLLKKWLLPLILFALLLAAGGGIYWWIFMHGRVSTDDAYVKAHSANISTRIWGTVIEVKVDNDDTVKEGQILVRLDPEDYQTDLDSAQALLDQWEAEVRKAEVQLGLTDSQTEGQVNAARALLNKAKEEQQAVSHQIRELEKKMNATRADLTYAREEAERYKKLFQEKSSSQQSYDNALKNLKVARANLKAVEAELKSLKASRLASKQQVNQAAANLEIARSGRKQVQIGQHNLESFKAQRDRARASLDQARRNLSYCTIRAPLDGSIAQRNIQIGDRVQPGVPFMSIVPLDHIYVEANFKETQLTHVLPGQPAVIKAEIYPGTSYSGRVSGIRPGTGAAFSVLPPQNATGNWIKVVQRVPVTIEFKRPLPKNYPLRIGLSLTVTVDTRNSRSGTP